MSQFAETPQPPYYVVVFTAKRTSADAAGYQAMAEALFVRASGAPGFLGLESARNADGFGIAAAYFKDEAAILHWKNNSEHLAAQRLGQERWYEHYEVRIAKVERAYGRPS
jgi:heme-degrading monooxygenase HmoA